jgi:hypothetical protein
LRCLFFIDLRILITPLVSSNSCYGFWLTLGIFKLTFLPLLEDVRVMVFNGTSNNISVIWWQLVLLTEETEYQEKSIIRKYYPEWHQPTQNIFRSQRNASFILTEVVVYRHTKLKLNINLSTIKILPFLRKIIPKVNKLQFGMTIDHHFC